MKKVFLIAVLSIAYITNAQTLSYNDLGVNFTNETINGTARYNAMSGAFGALGGDLSAMDLNPAGAAVFLNSEFSFSLSNRNTNISSKFYGENSIIENDYTNITQAGGVFVFNNYYRNSGWGKVAFGFNFNVANDFENSWIAGGNSGFAPITDFYDPDVNYGISDGQDFKSFTDGKNNKYSFIIASQYNDNLYVGASLNTFDVDFYQNVVINEYNSDTNGNTFDVSQVQELLTYGDGVSFGVGFISKPSDNVRLGLSYQSPVWYNLVEEFVEYDVEIDESISGVTTDFSGVNGFDYKVRTPSKLTGSFAYIFDKQGLISLDYTYKNYSNIKLKNEIDFVSENNEFASTLNSVGELRFGTEWRFDELSVRGGYHFEKSPYKNANSNENKEGFSVGLGYKFRGAKVDLSYQKSLNNSPYSMYNNSNINPIDLEFSDSKLTATLVISI